MPQYSKGRVAFKTADQIRIRCLDVSL
jgi:hypothetical protein